MMASGAAQIWKSVKPHTPLIRFRKGGMSRAGAKAESPRASVASGPVIDDSQLPPRYSRRPVSKEEIEIINRGGPE